MEKNREEVRRVRKDYVWMGMVEVKARKLVGK
jgi:hypothetical protein